VSNSNNRNFFAVFGVLFGAVCWGVIWYPYRLLAESGISGVTSSLYTYVIASVLGMLLYAGQWRGVARLPLSVAWLALAAGWTNLSYVLAIIDGEVMRVMLLFYLSPVWTLILAHFWLKEKTQISGYVTIIVSLLGATVMLHDPQTGSWPLPREMSEWLALGSGMGFSLTNVITRKSSHLSLQAKTLSVWLGVMFVSILFLAFDSSWLPKVSDFSPQNVLLMSMIALCLMAATLFVQYGVSRIAATSASVLFLFELVIAAVASYYLAHESMSAHEWLGGALIVAAAVYAATTHRD